MKDELQGICVEILCEEDVMYENAISRDITSEFMQYIEETVKFYGIVLICIRGYMRSSKSSAGFFICKLIRYFQKKYINADLPELSPENLILINADLIDEFKKGEFDTVKQADETVTSTGVGSHVEDVSLVNIMEVCARSRKHGVFIRPSEFAYKDICKYGLMFFDRDDVTKTSRFLLYDLSNNYHKDMEIPLGLVTIPKLYDAVWKEKNKSVKEKVDDKEVFIGQKFDSEFEYDYETGVKLEIVNDQMKLMSAKKRSQRLFKYIDALKEDKKFMDQLKTKKGMNAKRFIRGYVAKMLGGEFNSEEIRQLTDYMEGIMDEFE